MMHKVLLIRFSAIGDLLLTAPVIRELKKEGAHITLLVKDQFRTTATLLEGVDMLLSWEKDSKALLKTAASEYHRIIDLQGTAQSKRYARKIKLPRGTFKKPYLRRALLLLTRSKTFALPSVVERYAAAAGVMLSKDKVAFVLPDVAAFQGKIVAVIGGSHAGKRLTAEQWLEILKSKPQEELVLLGGPGDRELAEEIKAVLPMCADATQTSVAQAMAIVAEAKLVISGDTGFMHAAALMHVPLVSLWGATHPMLGFGPWPPQKNQREVITKGKSPLSKHGKVPIYASNPMRELDTEEVKTAIAEILQGRTMP